MLTLPYISALKPLNTHHEVKQAGVKSAGLGSGDVIILTTVFSLISAKVAELVDALDLGSSAARRESSSLSFRTIKIQL